MTAATRRHVAAVVLLAALLLLPDLGARTLGNNDEARFPVLARGLLAGDPWLAPSLNGAPYHNKPPLLAWLIALASWPAGHVDQLTAVLPSALAALGMALTLQAFGREAFGQDAGTCAALVALTTQGVFLHARLAMPDMLMTTGITGAVWMLWRMTRDRRGPNWLGFYGLTAAAFWAKGPAGLLPLAVALAWAALGVGPDRWRRLRLGPGLALVVALVAPWWLIGLLSDRQGMAVTVSADHVEWYLPRRFGLATLAAPFQNLFNVLFPWVLAVPLVIAHVRRFLRGRGAERDAVHFVLVWGAVMFVLVALAGEQRFRYYVPVVPPVALLLGWWWAGMAVQHRSARGVAWRWYLAVAGAVVAVAFVGMLARGRLARELAPLVPESRLVAAVLVAALALIVVALVEGVRRDRLAHGLRAAWVGAAVLLLVGYHAGLERRNRLYDYPQLAASVAPVVRAAPAAFTWEIHDLPLSFYVGSPLTPLPTAQALGRLAAATPGAVVIAAQQRVAELGPGEVVAEGRLGPRPVSVMRYGGASPR